MRNTKLWLTALAACLFLAAPGFADHRPGHVAKGDGGATTPAIITFRDCQAGFPSAPFANLHPGSALLDLCPVLDDRIKSDTGLAYEDGVQVVEAFLGSQANFGNVWLKLVNSPRGLFLDFTECASPSQECKPPFASQVVSLANIKVDANMVVGESISAPMRVYYWLSADQGPGFVDFNPNLTGKSPCKNKSNFITVTRTGDATWEVIADPHTIACVILPGTGGAGFGGTYRMPFQFTARIK